MGIGWSGYERERPTGRCRPCPPHGPMMVSAVEWESYVARCMRCGLSGPAREDGVAAKQAFDEAFEGDR